MTLNLQQLNRIAINYKLTVHNNEEKYKACFANWKRNNAERTGRRKTIIEMSAFFHFDAN
jgi:hypothetical protein